MSEIMDEKIKDMFEKDSTPLVTLQNLIDTESSFRIPVSQRGYVWDTKYESVFQDKSLKDCNQDNFTDQVDLLTKDKKKFNKLQNGQLDYFWEDILRIVKNKQPYYMGMMSLEPITQGKENSLTGKGYYVIDGQQRLTTCAILLNVIKTKQTTLKLGYSDCNQTYQNVLDTILGSNSNVIPNNLYFQRLSIARSFFLWKVKSLTDEEKETLEDVLLNFLKFNILFCDNSNSLIVFETLNNRGQELTKLEILKNRTYFLLDKIDNDAGNIKDIERQLRSCWSNIFDNLGVANSLNGLKKSAIPDESFLQAFWIIEQGNVFSKSQTEVLNDLFNMFNLTGIDPKTNQKIKASKLITVLKRMENFSLGWKEFFNCEITNSDGEFTKDLKRYLNKLCRLTSDIHIQACIIGIYLSDIVKEKDKNILQIFNFLEQYLFCVQFLYSNNVDFSFLVSTVSELYHTKIEEDRDKGIKASYIILKSLIELITDVDPNNKQKDQSTKLKNLLTFENLSNWLQTIKKKRGGFYSWKGCNYYLYERNLADHGQKTTPITICEWIDIPNSIEHIYPQTPKAEYWGYAFINGNIDDSYYGKIYPKNFKGVEFDNSKMINSLGNLIPLSVKNNSSAKNKPYPYKKDEIYTKKGSNTSEELAKKLQQWNIFTLAKRNLEMFKWILKRWTTFTLNIKWSNISIEYKNDFFKNGWKSLLEFDEKSINENNELFKLEIILLDFFKEDFNGQKKKNIIKSMIFDARYKNQLDKFLDKLP